MPENCRVGFFLETAMRALILASAVGLAFVASAQAAPLAPNPVSIELGAAPSVELCVTTVDAGGIGPAGAFR